MREGTYGPLGSSACLATGNASYYSIVSIGLMAVAEMPLDLALAHPILNLDVLLACFALADSIKVLKLERLIRAKLTCIAGGT